MVDKLVLQHELVGQKDYGSCVVVTSFRVFNGSLLHYAQYSVLSSEKLCIVPALTVTLPLLLLTSSLAQFLPTL